MSEAENTPKTGPKKRAATSGSFKPGRSGNPGGRPKLTAEEREVRELARAKGPRCIERLDKLADGTGMVAVAANNSILDRALGKPRQEMDIEARVDAKVRGPTVYLPAEDADPTAAPKKTEATKE